MGGVIVFAGTKPTTSRYSATAREDVLRIATVPELDSGSTARFAVERPAPNCRSVTIGAAVPPRQTVKPPAAAGRLTASRASTADTLERGTPPAPATATVRVPPAGTDTPLTTRAGKRGCTVPAVRLTPAFVHPTTSMMT